MFTVYRMYDNSNRLLYIGHSESALGRLGEHAEKQAWWPEVKVITLEQYSSYPEMRHAEEMAIQNEEPAHNQIRYECVAHLEPLPLPTYSEKVISITVPPPEARQNKPKRRHWNEEKKRIQDRLIAEGRLTRIKPIGA